MRKIIFAIALLACLPSIGQVPSKIEKLEKSIHHLSDSIHQIQQRIDSLKLDQIILGMEEMGWPTDDYTIVKHSAMAIGYDEEYKMARWVAHVILTDVATGNAGRTNDFRPDPHVSDNTAVEADYFVTSTNENNEIQYHGYGYDRGHLAPSADFRWNEKALSESYFYSNISPQTADFNRKSWADLEGQIRRYAIANETNLFVVTGPVIEKDLPRIEKGVNKLIIPKYFYKVALDTLNKKAIGFVMPNELCTKPLEYYAKPIKEIEEITGLNFFPNFEAALIDSLESGIETIGWLDGSKGDYAPLKPSELGKKQMNTIQAYDLVNSNKSVEVCGTVAGAHKSKKGNIFINLDKQFPNPVFTLTIWSRDAANFSYEPHVELKSQRICAYGKVTKGRNSMEMNISNEKQIRVLEESL